MQSMLILLAGALQATPDVAPPMTVAPSASPIAALAGRAPPSPSYRPAQTPVLGGSHPGCAPATTTVNDTVSGGSLMWREGGEAVGHYLLLDRQVNGCPAPIVVNYRVPGSVAVGRELGRDVAPPPRSFRAD